MKSNDEQALFLSGDTGSGGSYYLGAYRIGNKEYYGGLGGTPSFKLDLLDRPNIYDYFRDGQWHMVEFKSVDFSAQPWPYFKINSYTGYDFNATELSCLMIYNKELSAEESAQNFEAMRGRYRI